MCGKPISILARIYLQWNRLEEAEETLNAIRHGEVDALVGGRDGEGRRERRPSVARAGVVDAPGAVGPCALQIDVHR